MKAFVTTMAALIAAWAVVPAQGVLVTKNGNPVFFDNFEAPAIGAAPDNGALPGTWSFNGSQTSFIRDQPSSLGSAIPPYDGNQMTLVTPNTGTNELVGTFSESLLTGDTLHIEMAVWDTTLPGNFNMAIRLYDTAGVFANSNWLNMYVINGGSSNLGSNKGNFNTLVWLASQWNKFELDYVVGSTTLTATLNGVSESITIAPIVDVGSIRFDDAGTNTGHYYLDNTTSIPEPASLVLLGLGGLAMLRRRA